ncbi:hypothetical protein Pcinc_000950 [Petrolisthes cinctipes]|uniref:Ig-like domain-containing protein n=1 Tax=Petrolisthes cinctipes TaxID=88211 RepID=A0AAE1L3L5_PETCI|nr:hypothetical protein Pcinc_000950 [Petrolisthes cinctipes]
MEYVVERGGKVTVACTVKAHPAVLTFTWALKSTPGESQGRGEGRKERRGEWMDIEGRDEERGRKGRVDIEGRESKGEGMGEWILKDGRGKGRVDVEGKG